MCAALIWRRRMNIAELINPVIVWDLILPGFALLLVAIGFLGWWLAMHPTDVQAFLFSLGHRLRAMRAKRCYRTRIELMVQWFRPEGAFVLSLTIGLALLVVSVWIFGGVLHAVLGNEAMVRFDRPIVSYVAAHRLGWLTDGMETITCIGSELFLGGVICVAGLVLLSRTRTWHPLLLVAVALLGAMMLEFATKLVIARPRPAVVWMALPTTGFAFPSGHSTESTATYGALAYVIAQTQKDWRAKVASLSAGAVIVMLIGVSRVYLGVHWPTDVMAGWALGCAWLAIIFTTFSTVEKTRLPRVPHDPGAQS